MVRMCAAAKPFDSNTGTNHEGTRRVACAPGVPRGHARRPQRVIAAALVTRS
jgi:hypothetical protein